MDFEETFKKYQQLVPHTSLSTASFLKLFTTPHLTIRQGQKHLNRLYTKVLKLGRPGISTRTELAVAQVLIITRNLCQLVPSNRDFQDIYFISKDAFDDKMYPDLVESNKSLPLFAWYMKYALMILCPHSQMDFICNVVGKLCGEKMQFKTGGGTESFYTAMRYRVFEVLSGKFRPKTEKQSITKEELHKRKPGLLLPIPEKTIALIKRMTLLDWKDDSASIDNTDITDREVDESYTSSNFTTTPTFAQHNDIITMSDSELRMDQSESHWMWPVQDAIHCFQPLASFMSTDDVTANSNMNTQHHIAGTINPDVSISLASEGRALLLESVCTDVWNPFPVLGEEWDDVGNWISWENTSAAVEEQKEDGGSICLHN